MSDKGKDMGVFNIVNKRTGKKYTAGSTNIDQLMNKYDYEMEHGTHHNEELMKDREEGNTFRFEVVSRDCNTEDEVRALRDAEISRNRNNTYNKDVKIYFDGGNPNAEFLQGKRTEKLNNVEDFTNSHNPVKTKGAVKKQYSSHEPSIKNEKPLKKKDMRKSKKNIVDFGKRNEERKKREKQNKQKQKYGKKSWKTCPKCGSRVTKTYSTCYKCGYEFLTTFQERITGKGTYWGKRTPIEKINPQKENIKKTKKNIVDFGKRNREKAKRLEKEKMKKNITRNKDLIKYINQNKNKIDKEFEEELMLDINNGKITTKTQIFKRIEKESKENRINDEIKDNELEKETKKCPNCGMLIEKKYSECPICHNQMVKSINISPEEAKRNIQKKRLRNIVENRNLDFLTKIILLEKIRNYEITDKQELEVAMSKDLSGEYRRNLLKEKIEKNNAELKKTLEQSDIDDDLKEIIVSSINMARIADDDYISNEIRKINLIQTIFSPNHISSEPPYLFKYELKKLYKNKIPNEEDIQKTIMRVRGRIHKPSSSGGSSSGRDVEYHPQAKWGW